MLTNLLTFEQWPARLVIQELRRRFQVNRSLSGSGSLYESPLTGDTTWFSDDYKIGFEGQVELLELQGLLGS